MKKYLFLIPLLWCLQAAAQKLTYEVTLFGKKIGQTIVERIDKGNGETQYKLKNSSEVSIFFTRKTSEMNYDILYRDGKLISAYVRNVKDGITEIINILWEGGNYLIKHGEETSQIATPIDFSSILLYFTEPKTLHIFSERLGRYCKFVKSAKGVYECRLENGVNNIYRYENGKLMELEMSKGASVFMKLVQ